MDKKFAFLEYASTNEEIIKKNIIKKCPTRVIDWYIKKFNPYIMEEVKIGDIEGLRFIMPFCKKDINSDFEKVLDLTERTIKVIENYNIKVVDAPKNYKFKTDSPVYFVKGKYFKAYFLKDAIKNIAKKNNIEIKNAEIVIIDDEEILTEIILENIYLDVNHITILSDKDFSIKVRELFEDSGININVAFENRYILENADIIINTSEDIPKYDYLFKKNAVYFELSQNDYRFKQLVERRSDMIFIDDFKLRFNNIEYKLTAVEMIFYILCREYRHILGGNYRTYFSENIKDMIKSMDIKFAYNYCLDKKILI